MAFAETAELAVKLSLKDNLSRGLNKAAASVKGFDRATSNTQASISKMGANLSRLAVVGLAATAAGLVGVVKAASDYESAFAGVRKTVTATEPQLQKLSDQFRALAKEIPISAAALARLGEAGGALGIATEDLREFVRVSALLGVTTDLSADQAAESLGILSNVLHLTGDEYDNFASSLVALGNAGASTESQIIEIAQRAGAAGELIGLTTAQVLGFASSVASLGIEIEAGGSALQKFFIDTTKQVAKGGKELKLLAKVAGLSAKAFAKAYDQDAGAALQRFLAGLGKLSKAEQLAVLEALKFNDVRITRTLLGLANNTALVSDQMLIANDAFAANTALTKEAEQRFKTFDSALQITKNTFTDMAITIGSQLLPKLVPLLTRLNAFINDHQADIAKFGADLALGFEKFADAVSRVDFKGIAGGLELTGRVAKTIIDAFLSLPPDIQKVAVAALAINKVGGGIITSGLKDIVGLVLSRLTTIQAANVTVIGANVAGGLPGGGKGGGLPGTVKTVAGVTILGIAAVAGHELTQDLNASLAQAGVTRTFQNPANILNMPGNAINAIGLALDEINGKTRLTQPVDIVRTSGGMSPDERQELRNLQRLEQLNTDVARAIGNRTAGTIETTNDRIRAAVERARAATMAAGQQTAFAIRDKRMTVTTNVETNLNVDGRTIARALYKYKSTPI